MENNLGTLDSYRRALEAAVYDCTVENRTDGTPCRMYFDADAVIGAFLGMAELLKVEQSPPLEPPPLNADPQRSMVVRCLWATGFGCEAAMLWPHEAELRRLWLNLSGSSGADDFAKIHAEADRVFSPEKTAAIRQALEQSRASSAALAKLGSLLTLRDFALGMSAAFPTWRERISYVKAHLVLGTNSVPDAGRPYMAQNMPGLALFTQNIQSFRIHRHQQRHPGETSKLKLDRNVSTDACALIELSRLVMEDRTRSVRFYTTTQAILDAVNTNEGRLYFGLPPISERIGAAETDVFDSNTGVLDNPQGPFRSTQYVLLRSLIPSLQFRDRTEPPPSIDDLTRITLDTLKSLLDSERLKREIPADLARRLSGEGIGGGLQTIVSLLENAAGFLNVWANPDSSAVKTVCERISSLRPIQQLIEASEGKIEEASKATLTGVIGELELRHRETLSLLRPKAITYRPAFTEIERRSLWATGVGRWVMIDVWLEKEVERLERELTNSLLLPPEAARELWWRWFKIADHHNKWPVIDWLFANAALFSKGLAPIVLSNLNRAEQDGFMKRAAPYVHLTALILRDCAELAGYVPGRQLLDLDAMLARSSNILEEAVRFHARGVGAISAWRAFYWCHAAAKTTSTLSAEAAEQVQYAIQSNASAALAGLRRSMGHSIGSVKPNDNANLLEQPVEQLLAVYAGVPLGWDVSDNDRVNIYCMDAYTWELVQTNGSLALVQDAVDRRNRAQLPSYENYLHDHRKEINAWLAARNVER